MTERYHHVQPGTNTTDCGRHRLRLGASTFSTVFWSVVTCNACLRHRPKNDRTCDIDDCDGHHCECGAHVNFPGNLCQTCGIDP